MPSIPICAAEGRKESSVRKDGREKGVGGIQRKKKKMNGGRRKRKEDKNRLCLVVPISYRLTSTHDINNICVNTNVHIFINMCIHNEHIHICVAVENSTKQVVFSGVDLLQSHFMSIIYG